MSEGLSKLRRVDGLCLSFVGNGVGKFNCGIVNFLFEFSMMIYYEQISLLAFAARLKAVEGFILPPLLENTMFFAFCRE